MNTLYRIATALAVAVLSAPVIAQQASDSEEHTRRPGEQDMSFAGIKARPDGDDLTPELDRFELGTELTLDLGLSLGMLQDEPAPPAGSAPPPPGGASKHAGKSADEIARELANPNSDLAQLKFKNIFTLYDGDLPNADDQWNYTLLFQPIFPFTLGETANGGKKVMFVRPAFPLLIDQPVFNPGSLDFSDVSGLGDIGFDWAFGVTEKTGWLYAAGMVGTLPTATDSRLGAGKLSLGPEVLVAKQTKAGLFGGFVTHQWDVAGWGDNYVNKSTIEPVALFFPGGGWTIGTNGILSYNWRTEDWTIPLNFTVSKTTKIGDLPLKIELQLEYYVEQPDAFGQEWAIYLNFTPVVPNFIEAMFKGG